MLQLSKNSLKRYKSMMKLRSEACKVDECSYSWSDCIYLYCSTKEALCPKPHDKCELGTHCFQSLI